MSYEGYVQCFCTNGHLVEIDAYDTPLRDENGEGCCQALINGDRCKAKLLFQNHVDDTNCEAVGRILESDLEVYQISNNIKDPITNHISSHRRYEFPSMRQLKRLMTYKTDDNGIAYMFSKNSPYR
jgi:hypothetical protein